MYHLLLMDELGDGSPIEPAPLFVDNLPAVQISKDPVTANNMKHVARRHFYVREVQEMGLIRVCWWHGKGNEADALPDQGFAEGETHVLDEKTSFAWTEGS